MCIALNKDATKCKGKAMVGSEYCFFHNPDISKMERKRAQAKGGRNRRSKITVPLRPMHIQSSGDIVWLLGDTINQVRTGKMDVKVANCIGVLGSHLLRALELSNLEQRIGVLEKLTSSRE